MLLYSAEYADELKRGDFTVSTAPSPQKISLARSCSKRQACAKAKRKAPPKRGQFRK
jgi:hypothetical protein